MQNYISCVSWNTLAQCYFSYGQFKLRYPHINFSNFTWEKRLTLIREMLMNANPDIICLQEIELATIKQDFIDYLNDYYSCYHTINKNRKSKIGNLTLWKKSLECINTNISSCGIFVTLKKNKEFQIVNIHLKAGWSKENERIPQLKSVIKRMDKIPSIICGDFNDQLKHTGALHKILTENHFNCYMFDPTCYAYNDTIENFINYISYDHIAANVKINVEKITLYKEMPNEDEPSDHKMIKFIAML